MPAILFIAGMLVAALYSPSQKDIIRNALELCGPDQLEGSRPSYCPKDCR